jgi:hypothetical protein
MILSDARDYFFTCPLPGMTGILLRGNSCYSWPFPVNKVANGSPRITRTTRSVI